MKKLFFEFSPLMAIMLILAIILPVGASLNAGTPVYAAADNCFITSPTSATGSVAYSRINGQVPVTFTVVVSGVITSNIDISIFLLSGTTVVGAPSTFLTSALGAGTHTFTYNLTIPAGTANGTYGVRVDARHPSGTGTYTSSLPSTSSIVVNSTAVPAAPTVPLPACASCYSASNPTFSWTHSTATGETYWFELATASSFSPTLVSQTTSATKSYAASGLLDGTYYWRVKTVDKYGNPSAWLTCSICIDLVTPSDPSPLLLPVDGSTVGGCYNPQYSWTRSTDSSPCANMYYLVQTFSDAGLTTIVDNVTVTNPGSGNPTYTRNSTLGSGTFYWNVTALDCAGRSSATIGPFSFTIPACQSSANINLGTGWNLISLPLIPNSTAIATVLTGISSNIAAVWYWDYGPSYGTPTWKYYFPGSGGTLATMEDGKAYWINVNTACTLTISGTQAPAAGGQMPMYHLCIEPNKTGGWNMLGFKSLSTTMTANDYLAGIPSKWAALYKWAGGYQQVLGTGLMEPGVGYWIYMIAPGDINPPLY